MRRASLAGTAFLLATLLGGAAMAGVINIGNGATGSNPTGTTCGACDPVPVGIGSNFSIEVQGSASITDQVLLGILIPNNTTDLFGGTDPLGTITLYSAFPGASTGPGSSAFTGTGFNLGDGTATYQGNGFWGAYDPNPAGSKLQDFLDSKFNDSLNGTNFLAWDAANGILSVTDFGVYTIAITTGPLGPAKGKVGLVDIQIPGGLPNGTILVALDDNLDSTVWTNSGGVDTPPRNVPEPATLSLLAAGLAGIFFLRRRKSA